MKERPDPRIIRILEIIRKYPGRHTGDLISAGKEISQADAPLLKEMLSNKLDMVTFKKNGWHITARGELYLFQFALPFSAEDEESH